MLVIKNKFIQNKYTVSALILLALLGADILLHKGMSRVMLPASFTEKAAPLNNNPCRQLLVSKEKKWTKAVNTISQLNALAATTAGIECDVYFDSSCHCFRVYHDSTSISSLTLDSLLPALQTKLPNASVWFDFKNLEEHNSNMSLQTMQALANKFQLQNKIIVESSTAKDLKQFCDSGFFTSYYIPYFNPYEINEEELLHQIDSIKNNLQQYPSSAVSGYYFQYPILKRFFPKYPILTWVDKSYVSIVSYFFNRQLQQDESIRIVLFPSE